jgi:hypothetical protein
MIRCPSVKVPRTTPRDPWPATKVAAAAKEAEKMHELYEREIIQRAFGDERGC